MEIGDLIKQSRRAKKLTQSELAKGICTQATISNLENGSSVPTVPTLKAIAYKLKIDFLELANNVQEGNNLSTVLKTAKKQLREFKYSETKKLLQENVNSDNLTQEESKEYNYYMGIANLVGEKNYKDAYYHLNLGIQEKESNSIDLIDTLLINALGVAYFLEGEINKSKVYFTKSLTQLETLRSKDDSCLDLSECVKIYYNTAKYFSHVENYEKAIELCSIGIILQIEDGNMQGIEMLYYEKGYNLCKINQLKNAKKVFFICLAFCEVYKNLDTIDLVLKHCKEYGIPEINFEKEELSFFDKRYLINKNK